MSKFVGALLVAQLLGSLPGKEMDRIFGKEKKVPVPKDPNPDCPDCKGAGRMKKGKNSKKFKRCPCTFGRDDDETSNTEDY